MASTTCWIADSGGTKTEWALCQDGKVVRQLTTAGLHPRYLPSLTAEDRQQLKTLLAVEHLPVYFYGAGCARPASAELVQQELLKLGFSEAHVYPDSLGACRSLLGDTAGMVAILGTGSIVLEYDGTTIVKRFGGFGPLIGDEGSGVHFARLVVRDYLSGRLKETDHYQLTDILGTEAEVLTILAGNDAIQWLAGLAKKLTHVPLENYHRTNFEQWLQSWFPEKPDCKQLSVTGSYGHAQQEMLRSVLNTRSIVLDQIAPTPMTGLINYHLKTFIKE